MSTSRVKSMLFTLVQPWTEGIDSALTESIYLKTYASTVFLILNLSRPEFCQFLNFEQSEPRCSYKDIKLSLYKRKGARIVDLIQRVKFVDCH